MRAVLTGPAALRAPIGGATTLIVDAAAVGGRPFRRPGEDTRLYLQVRSPDDDLTAAVTLRPDDIVLTCWENGCDVAHLGARLAVLEAEAGLADGAVGIIAMIATARSVFGLSSLIGASPRLAGIAWDADALAVGIGAPTPRDDAGLIPQLLQVRGLLRLAAAAAAVEAIDTAYPADGGDIAFLAELGAARRDGFGAKLAMSADHATRIASRC
jgi:citrate lyase subunit beta/citryl-CoA lyase